MIEKPSLVIWQVAQETGRLGQGCFINSSTKELSFGILR
jgi:hypothetical protein